MRPILSVVFSVLMAIGPMLKSAMGQCEGSVVGTVRVAGEPCIDCAVKVLMSPTGTSLVWPTADETLTDQFGSYSLSVPENAEVIVIASGSSDYPFTVPTFSGNTTKWGQAQTVINSCAEVFQFDIDIVEHVQPAGNTTFRGKVYVSSGKTASDDPIPLIDVVVEKTPPGNAFGATVTDENGEFVFEFIEADLAASYTIRINLPCVPMAGSYTIDVGNDDLEFANLDFCLDADTTSIINCTLTGIATFPDEVINRKRPQMILHPEADAVSFTFDADRARLELFALTGATVVSSAEVDNGQMVRLDALAPGMYVAELQLKGQTHRLRVPRL